MTATGTQAAGVLIRDLKKADPRWTRKQVRAMDQLAMGNAHARILGMDDKARPVLQARLGIPQQLRTWALLRNGEVADAGKLVEPWGEASPEPAPQTLHAALLQAGAAADAEAQAKRERYGGQAVAHGTPDVGQGLDPDTRDTLANVLHYYIGQDRSYAEAERLVQGALEQVDSERHGC